MKIEPETLGLMNKHYSLYHFHFRALYVFFMQAKVYADIQDSCLSVHVRGDVDEARTYDSTELENSGKLVLGVKRVARVVVG